MRFTIGLLIGLSLLGGIIVAEGRGDLFRWSDPEGGPGFCSGGGSKDSCPMVLLNTSNPDQQEPVAP